MKIGLVLDTTLDSDAGVQQYFKGLARFLLKKGHDVRFLVPPSKDEGEFAGLIYSLGKTVTISGNANTVPTSFWVSKQSILKVLDKERFDILHISAPFMPQFGARVINCASCPVVSSYTIYSKNKLFRFWAICLKFLLIRTYRKIDAFIAVSSAAKHEAEKTLPGDYQIIPVGIDLKEYSPTVKQCSKYQDDKLTIVTVGRLEVRKGVDCLIRAFHLVKQQIKNVRLVIVGDGPQRKKLELLVKELALEDVHFEGYVDEEEKPSYHASADVCVFPSLYGESFGVVLIEAMASGRATLAFANEGYTTVLGKFPKLLIDPGNIEELASRIVLFLKDKQLRLTYAQKCLQEARQYEWDVVGERILGVYQGLVKSH